MTLRQVATWGFGLLVVAWFWTTRTITHAPGVLVDEAPRQVLHEGEPDTFEVGKHHLTKLAQFEVRARVLSTERYWFDQGADLSPEDLALGWGKMSDTAAIDQLGIYQGGRFYGYHWSHPPPMPPDEIISSSSNMHIIPATPDVARALKRVREGHIVDVKGYLVRADDPDGWYWVSSLSRTDSGAGACELVWAESIEVSTEPIARSAP